VQKILKDGLRATHVVVGEDFRFGQLRKGEAKDIEAAGIPVTSIPGVIAPGGEIYSSSLIRTALRHGEIEAANDMLGWPWEMRGTVIGGDKRGRELGYPTANFALGQTIHPAYGVYAAHVNIEGESEWYDAAINIGIRPMFEIPEAEVESYIFDFNRDIYGKTLRVQPVKRLRSEAKFNSLDELKAQIKIDCEQVLEILNK
jgi:riboflavin kinase/FMN adenylyltransferase